MAHTDVQTSASSSNTLWAIASKEWVIQPKPKPGRKPKKDVTSSKQDDEPQTDSKGRRIQNRAAQRAFRERKQSQLAELQARVQSYEQGEIERNVALQNIAKRLKEENEALRLENALLKERMLKTEQTSEALPVVDRKRGRGESPVSNAVNKKSKTGLSCSRKTSLSTVSYTPSPPSMVSSPDSNGTSDTRCSPLPYEEQADSNQSSLSTLLDFPSIIKSAHIDGNGFPSFNCGFCSEDTPCICREFAAQQTQQTQAADRMADYKVPSYNPPNTNTIIQITNPLHLEPPSIPARTSILENLPAYQPPVPLRRRPTSLVNAVFAVTPSIQPILPANCSGDPSNCMACADDAFGKAFCSAIGNSIAAQTPCTDCPCIQGQSSRSALPTSLYTPSAIERVVPETMPTNDAWRQIKSHPNVAFTDLSLLADVVARRSKCTGPRVVISPAPGSITPERTVSPSSAKALPSEHDPVILTDPHAHYRAKERARSNGPSSPHLVPQEILLKCARPGVREVHTDAVRAALRLLDARFT